MRLFLGFSASSAFISAIVAGCGSSSNPAGPQDSGNGDVTMEAMPMQEAAAEAAPEAAMEAMSDVCVPDATIMSLPVPDAAIGDSGATTSGCLTCFESACMTVVSQCNQSCVCIAAFQSFESCVAAGLMTVPACAFNSFSGVPGISITMLGCALGCATACGQMLPVPDGGEGGVTESGADTGGGG